MEILITEQLKYIKLSNFHSSKYMTAAAKGKKQKRVREAQYVSNIPGKFS